MQTVTVDIINDDALKLLEDLELLKLIKVRKSEKATNKENPLAKLKGAMAKQPVDEIERQLKELRDEWE